jgi:DNA polymerase-3 subunit beta
MPVEVAPAVAAITTTMEITVSKFELLRELTATQGVVERKTTIPILSNYLFEAAGDKLSLTATDLDLSLRTSCNAKVKKEGACTIPARKLYDYVKLLPDADITIRLLENHWVSIRCGRSNTKMVGMAKSNFPGLPVFPSAGAIKIPAAVLRSMIAKTGFAIASEESRYTLNGALMVLKPESITMVATDGHRLAHVERAGEKFEGVSGEMKTLIPKKAMDELKSLLDSDRSRDHRLRQRRVHAVLPRRPASADVAPTDRAVPQLRSRAAKGHHQVDRVARRRTRSRNRPRRPVRR